MTKPLKGLIDLTDAELKAKHDKLTHEVSLIEGVIARRFLIDRYGNDTPQLKEYSADVTLTVPVTVHAEDEDDARELIEDYVYVQLGYHANNSRLISLEDMHMMEIDFNESDEEETLLAA